MNKELNYGKDVKNATAWCEQRIREATICIENLPADYYDDADEDDGFVRQYRDAEGQDGQDQEDEDQDQEVEGQNWEGWGQQWRQWSCSGSWPWLR